MRSQRRSSLAGPLKAALVALVLLASGVALCAFMLRDIRECDRIQRGERAEATIRMIEPTERSGRKNRKYYGFNIVYTFEHAGVTHTAKRLGVQKYEHRRLARRDQMIADLRQRQPLVAYFDPGDPTRALLDPEIPPSRWMPFVVGVAIIGAGLSAALFAYRSRYGEDGLPINTSAIEGGYEVRALGVRRIGVAMLALVTCVLIGVAGGVIIFNSAQVEAFWIMAVGVSMLVGWILAALLGMRIVPSGAGSLVLDTRSDMLKIRPIFGRGEGKTIPYVEVESVGAVFSPSEGVKPESKKAKYSLMLLVQSATQEVDGVPLLYQPFILSQFEFSRDEMRELVMWLRSELALEEDPERWVFDEKQVEASED